MPDTNVVIVGGGPAGLAASAALKRIGIESVILERADHIGASWTARYERLHLHTVRDLSGLPYYPIPRSYPRYVPKAQFAAYLQDYADRIGLDVRLNTHVRRIAQGERPRWRIETDGEAWHSWVVVVATGHFGAAKLPDWPGREQYGGRFLHSSQYKTGRDFAGQRALVIGAGNSGAEIAADLVEQDAAFVANSIRTPPPVVPRDALGMPVQAFGIMLHPLPPPLADRIGRIIARVFTGDLTRYGLKPAGWGPFTAHRVPIIDVGYVEQVKRGQIHLRPATESFTREGVVFADGREEQFDAVIAATGYQTGLGDLLDAPGALDEVGAPCFRSGERTPYPGLYFIGFTESVRGHLFEANRDARRLAGYVAMELAVA